MAFYSLQCVNCQDNTKRCVGKYRGTEGKGKRFYGMMYLCDNTRCNINIERMRGEKQFRRLEIKRN